MTPWEDGARSRWAGLALGLLVLLAARTATATTVHGLGFDTPVLADLADQAADAAVSELPISATDKSILAAAIRLGLLDSFLPGGPTSPTQLFDNGINDITADNYGNPLSIARDDFDTSLGVVGPFVERVLGAPRLELVVATAPLSVGTVQAWMYSTDGFVEVMASGVEVTGPVVSEFVFDGNAPAGWLEGFFGTATPGIASVTLMYAEAGSPGADATTLSYSSVALAPLAGGLWIGNAPTTPGMHAVYYYDVALDAPVTSPEGDTITNALLPDPRNLQWVDRGALGRLASAGASFGNPGDVNAFDPEDPAVAQRFASIAVRELVGSGDIGLASTFAIPDAGVDQLWHLSLTEALYNEVSDGDYEIVVEVYDSGSLVEDTEPVPLAVRYDPDATMNLSTAAATVIDNELFTVGLGFTLVGSVTSVDGSPLTEADGVTVTFTDAFGGEVMVLPDDAGVFNVTLPEGSYVATAFLLDYGVESVDFDLFVGGPTPTLDFVLIGMLTYVPAQHEIVEGETVLVGSAGDVMGGVAPYEFEVTGGSASFWLSVDSATGDLVFASGVTEAPGTGHYELELNIYDSMEAVIAGSFGVDVVEAPHSTLEAHFEGYGFTEGSPNVTAPVGEILGGVEPYSFEVTGGTAASWLDVNPSTGDLVFAAGVSYVPGPGQYELGVRVTDSAALPDEQPGVVDGSVGIDVTTLDIYWVQFSTGESKVLQSDLDAGDVTVILNLTGDSESLAEVALHGGDHSMQFAPDPAGNAAFVYMSAADIVSATTQAPAYGRYAVAFTPNGGSERTTSRFVNVVETHEQGWQGELWLHSADEGLAHVEVGAAVNAFDEYDPNEDVVDPPAPDAGATAAIGLWRDGIALHRDILAAVEDVPLVWYFDVELPDVDADLNWGFDGAESYYDVAILHDVDSGESHSLYETGSVPLVVGSYSFTLTLERSPYQKLWLHLTPQWTLLSLPGPSVEGNFDALADLFDVDAIYGWDPAAGYEGPIVGPSPLEHITRGYFVHRSDQLGEFGAEINVDLDDPTAVQADIPVETGWNIVGVVDGGIDAGSISPIANTVFTWDPYGQSYSEPLGSGDLLRPLQGAWVFNPGDPYVATVEQLRFRSGPSVAPTPQPQAQPDWLASLHLDTADGQARRVEVGSAGLADASYDAMDIVTPPPPAARGYAEFYADVDGIAGRLARSIQPLGREGGEWALTARMPGEGTIRWDGAELPVGYRLTLEADGQRHDMLRRGEVALQGGSHALRVTLAWQAPQRTRLLTNYPNPFNPETWIPFELSAGSPVTVRIYDLGGRVMRRLDLGYRDAGYYTARADAAYWDGRNDVGERVASGVYFYELRAGAQQSLRRMVIHK